MLSAVKNFTITFVVSAVIFGVIAYFVSDSIETGIFAGEPTSTEDGTGDQTGGEVTNRPFAYVTDESGNAVTDENGNPVTEMINDPVPDEVKGKSFNVLLVGTDHQPDVLNDYDLTSVNANIKGFKMHERTVNVDTIILVRVDKEKQSFVFMPIPTNTQIYVDGGNTTLSAVYSKHGLDFVCRKVRALTGLNIDYYVSMSIPKLVSAIDAIGGISYMVPVDMHYIDETQSLEINLKKGQQTLDGKKSLDLLRYSSYSDGNVSRMAIGVDFLKALLDKMTAPGYFDRAQSIYNSVVGYADTNFALDDLLENIDLIFSYSKYDKVNVSYPGVSKTEGGTNYFIPSYSEAIESLRIYR